MMSAATQNPMPEPCDLSRVIVAAEALACLSKQSATRLQVLPIALQQISTGKALVVACADANSAAMHERVCQHVHTGVNVQLVSASPMELREAIERNYKDAMSSERLLSVSSWRDYNAAVVESMPDIAVTLVNTLLVKARQMRASDIHLSPEATLIKIRFRVDGVLLNVTDLSLELHSKLLVRIKIMASLDIAESRFPQDGQFHRIVDAHKIDFRVSTFPTVNGENVVIRVLDSGVHFAKLDALNLPGIVQTQLRQLIREPQGMIVVCGPTGAGKSTSLFALLDEIDTSTRSVMTLEDPVEHRIDGIRQTSVDASQNWGYVQGLRALLRQDPDVLLVGEIRDKESCQIALNAVTTGHQVLTTVHASCAHSALHRLWELDGSAGGLALGLSAIVSQRLLRCVCKSCHGNAEADSIVRHCERCHGTGYNGRQVIMEVLVMTPELKHMVENRASIADIVVASEQGGFISMHRYARQLVESGITRQSEVERVLGGDKSLLVSCG